MKWCDRTNAAVAHWRPEVYRQDLDELLAATGDKAFRKATRPGMGWFARRSVLKRIKSLRTTSARPPSRTPSCANWPRYAPSGRT